MGLYSKQGLYAGYKKNNAEREALDYYATPPAEVTNILETMNLNLDGSTILEPCAGGGHIIKGLIDYMANHVPSKAPRMYTTDIQERTGIWDDLDIDWIDGKRNQPEIYDFLSDDYPYNKADYVIMNPPFSTIEPFVIRALEIAQKGMLMFGRIQFLEGQSRYTNILKDNPPNDVYIYVDRIKCGKNGDFENTEAIQCYAWFYWNKLKHDKNTLIHWIRRVS